MPEPITIDQILAEKKKTAEAIRDLIFAFSNKTGFVVSGIRFTPVDLSTRGGGRDISYTVFDLEVELPCA
jgi:hypothetical protein